MAVERHYIEAVAHLRSDFPSKFGVPRQSGLVPDLQARIVFTEGYRLADALRGLEGFSHIWLIWGFSANERRDDGLPPSKGVARWQATVRPPRLGGNTAMGVFATRSPFRPNGLGLSCVKLERIEWDSPQGPVIHVLGADLMDGTPIYDIKPYIAYADCVPQAQCGFVDQIERKTLSVADPQQLLTTLPAAKAQALKQVLAQDPRPSYQNDCERIYGLSFAGHNVKFRVENEEVVILALAIMTTP